MKKNIPIALGIVVFVLMIFPSCNKMDDIQREYADRKEIVYLGKVDSIVSYPGFNRAKITWYISADPRIDRTIIYWNLRKDSLVKEFAPTTSGLHKDSVFMNNLPEGSTLFEFRNVNKEGQTSLYSNASITVWGPKFADGLYARKLIAFDFDYSKSLFQLDLSRAVKGDSVVYSQIIYKDSNGEDKTLRIEREDTNSVKLSNFPDGGEFRFRTVFFPPQGIDTVYDDYAIYKAPKAFSERGIKISLPGDMANKYFERNQKVLYEWNAGDDVIVYNLNTDGSLSQTEKYPAILPRSAYRDFFFYDDDKFIGISKANGVIMLQIIDGKPVIVKTPAGADAFGAGFNFQEFLPAKGYFYSIAAGEMKIWLAQNNATWGTPNGKVAGKGYEIYSPLMLFNNQTLLGVDKDGYLWSIPVSVSGVLGSKSRIGTGWKRFKKIIGVGTTLYCMEMNGDFYVFKNFNTTNNYWIVN